VAYATNAEGRNVQVLTSDDLLRWQPAGDALPRVASWAEPGFTWAPTVVERDDAFVLYYTVREPRSGRQAISVATARRPTGPFTDVSHGPLIFQQEFGGSIDPSPFVDLDGQLYLLWKADANALNQPSSLWAQRLAPDGRRLVGSPRRLVDYAGAWEEPLIEAPSLVHHDGTYYLFYSANWWESGGYAVGYATASSVLGPYTRVTETGPWFASDDQVAGPGGQEFFVDHDGVLRMAYHGWEPGHIGYPQGARSLRIVPVSFVDGAPLVLP
jgi:beta-xylosidase